MLQRKVCEVDGGVVKGLVVELIKRGSSNSSEGWSSLTSESKEQLDTSEQLPWTLPSAGEQLVCNRDKGAA